MLARLYTRLVRAAGKRSWSAAQPFAAAAWVAALRMLGERFTAAGGRDGTGPPLLWLLHIFAFYVALQFSIAALLTRVAGAEWRRAANVAGLGLLLGVVPPWIDLLVYGRGGFSYEYQPDAAAIPWLLHQPPRVLPAGETAVLWASVALVAAYGFWRGRAPWRRLLTGPAFYLLILLYLVFVPASLERFARADAAVTGAEWRVPVLVGLAMVAQVLASGEGRRALRRLPQVVLAPLFCLAGGALRGRLDGPVWLAALLFGLLSLGFAVANDWYDRREDAERGPAVDEDTAHLLSLLPLVAVAGVAATRLETGLAALAFAVAAHAYHADPLRTKCVFPLSYKTEGMLAGLAFLGGLVADPSHAARPAELLVALAVAAGTPAAVVFKDWKDVDADRAAGVRTAFVVGAGLGWPARGVLGIAAALLLVALGGGAWFVAAQGAPAPWRQALVGLAAGAPALLLAMRTPRRAVLATLLACEAFLACAVAGLWHAAQ